MIKKIVVSMLAVIVLAAVTAGVYQKSQAATSPTEGGRQSRGYRPGTGSGSSGEQEYGTASQSQPSRLASQQTNEYVLPSPDELSQVEAEALLFMREEEKLARDVYTALYSTWGTPIFQNISASEQAHMDAIKNLLDTYNLADPVQMQPGVFTDPELQALYDELVAHGNISLEEALQVGAAIEEIDILDLLTRLAQTDNLDIQRVFNSLLHGSQNHLRSFTNTLQMQTGDTYQPQYLSLEEFQAIISQSNPGGANGNGAQDGQGGNGRRGGRS